MRRRPLCFLCIALIVLNFLFLTSGDSKQSPDVFSLTDFNTDSEVIIFGEIYQCEYSKQRLILYLKQTILSEQSQNIKLNRVKISCKMSESGFYPGDKVCAAGQLYEIEGASNPGQFDSQSYYGGKKIGYTMWEPEVDLRMRPKISFARYLYIIKMYFSGIIARCIKGENGNIMRGIVLGNKSDISKETTNLYQTGGISHILAISAMHLTILGNGLYNILKKIKIPISIAGVIAGMFLVCYGILTGSSIATLRALIMFLLNIGSQIVGRTYDGMTSLALAAVLLLSGNPLSLMDSGFLLSFSAMVSFSVFRENRKFANSILLYFFMAPVILWFFYELPLYSVFVNLLVVPTLCVVLVSGVCCCLFGGISELLGTIVSLPGVFLLELYEILCEIAEMMPGSKILLGRPSVLGIILYYGIMMLTLWLFRRYRLNWKRFFLLFLMVPACYLLIYHPGNVLKIAVLDIGQGDCIICETPKRHTYMIDGGSTSEKMVGMYRIWPYLKYQGISELEGIFITHSDEDHINGILELLENINKGEISLKIKRIILPDWDDMEPFADVVTMAENVQIPVVRMPKGGHLTDGEVEFSCLYPAGGDYKENPNEGSMVLRVTYRAFSGLLTGDLEGKNEEELYAELEDVDFLKVAHHGSRYSTYEELLKRIRPEISIISCGENNFYGHPHEELLKRLEKADSSIYRTDYWGAVWITTNGEKIDLHTFKQYNISKERD